MANPGRRAPLRFALALGFHIPRRCRCNPVTLQPQDGSPVPTIPHISLDSISMWVDEKRGKIYIAHKGQLLSIPLQATDERR